MNEALNNKNNSKETRKGKGSRYNKKDLTGQKIGRLTVIEPTDKRDSKGTVIWHCRCECGKETDISYDNLVYGHYYSCGCMKREKEQELWKNLTMVDHTCIEWLQKRKYRKDNSSGFRGVVKRKNGNYCVNIGFKQKRYYLGTYDTFEEAVQVRLKAEEMIHDGFIRACKRMKDKELVFDVIKDTNSIRIKSNDENENGSELCF